MYISVALAAWNGAKYMEKQLDSIRMQTRVPDEIVICDDASTDDTWELLQHYGKKWPDFPMKLLRNPENTGYRENFRHTLQTCAEDVKNEDVLCMLSDQDDVWLPDKVEVMERIFEAHPHMLVLASSFTLIDGEDRPLADRRKKGWSNQCLYHRHVAEDAMVRVPVEDFIYHNFAQGCSLAFRSSVRDSFLDHFTPDLPHDWQIVMAGAAEQQTWFYHHPLFQYRLHEDNVHGLQASAEHGRFDGDYRTLEARRALAFTDWVRQAYPAVYTGSHLLQRAEAFLTEDIRCMEQRDMPGLLRLIKSPDYRKLKSNKAAAADLIYVLIYPRRS